MWCTLLNEKNEWKGVYVLQCIVRLYRDSNLQRDEMKDDGPFRQTLAGFEPTLVIGLRFRGREKNEKFNSNVSI